jgi:phosphopantothenoylcysteine decarboxylase/phosphopantothenate--cysteine ligase
MLPAPPPSSLSDHDVVKLSTHLENKRVALVVTGGIAAYRTPDLARTLRRHGAEVTAFASSDALRYVAEDALAWSTNRAVITQLGYEAEHLSDANPFDAYLVAPATYNTINKVATGIADTPITALLASALGRVDRNEAHLLIAPTMHGTMHNQILIESLERLESLGTTVIPPRQENGKDNIPDHEVLAGWLSRTVSDSPLKGKRILVTGGPTPVAIDGIRRLTNKFTGRLGIAIATELYFRGVAVSLIHGSSGITPPSYLDHQIATSFDEYQTMVLNKLEGGEFKAAIFSAAVADYRPQSVVEGKIPSGGALSAIELVPTHKVIDKVQQALPGLDLISFKYEQGLTHDELITIADSRLERGHTAVIANRGEEMGEGREQIAYLTTRESDPVRMVGKSAIASSIADYLEKR